MIRDPKHLRLFRTIPVSAGMALRKRRASGLKIGSNVTMWETKSGKDAVRVRQFGIQFLSLSSPLLFTWLAPSPCWVFDMKPFINSVPVLGFFGLLSCAAPLLHVAGPLVSTAPFPNNERPLVMAYYPDWASHSLPPEKIDFERFDWIDFAFALPDQSFALTWDDPVNAPLLLDRLVASAHDAGKRVKLSIGGWTGSQLRIHIRRVFPWRCIQPLL